MGRIDFSEAKARELQRATLSVPLAKVCCKAQTQAVCELPATKLRCGETAEAAIFRLVEAQTAKLANLQNVVEPYVEGRA
eukprot:5359355-Amphidinium_carterae.1